MDAQFIEFLKANMNDFIDKFAKELDKTTDIDVFLKTLFADPNRRKEFEKMYYNTNTNKAKDNLDNMSSADKFDYYYKKYEQKLKDDGNYQQQKQQSYQQQKQQSYSKSYQSNPIQDKEAKYYEALEIKSGATWDEIKAAYKSAMKKYHPDKFHGDAEKQKVAEQLTQKINEAYTYLEKKFNKK
jgi:DnaJ-domain-containing protein 1